MGSYREYRINGENILPELPGINIDAGIRLYAGNVKSYKNLLIKFHDRYSETVNNIRAQLDNGDDGTAERSAHTLKSIAGQIGADILFDIARELESTIKKGNQENLASSLNSCGKELASVIEGLRPLSISSDVTPESSAFSAKEIDMKELAPILRELTTLLKDDDAKAIRLLEKLPESLKSSVVSDDYAELVKAVNQYDFNGAIDITDRIAKALNISF
ncbi:MAG: Hpt domain-containing protein [Thermodesulfobacteriota bacterium]